MNRELWIVNHEQWILHPSSTFLVNDDAYFLPYRLHTYLGLNINGSPY